jgi:di/tricarboxylate transporter
LLGVYALSAVISSSGLSYRLMTRLLLRLPDKPMWHQITLLGSGYILSPLMPSAIARMSLLTPVFKDMASGLKLPNRGPAITGLLAAMFGGALLFSPMMSTSKSSNIAALGLLPQQVQFEFAGLFWLVAAAVAAIGVTVVHLVALPRIFPSEGQAPLPRDHMQRKLADMGPLKPAEWIAASGFVFFLLGSATTSWHHIKPPYLAGFVLLALLLSGALLRKEFQRELDWPIIVFLLGIDSMMRIMDHLGLAQALARVVGQRFDFVDGRIGLFILITLGVTLAVRLVLPVTAGMLTAVVMLLPVAAAQGIHPWICVFCAAMFSDIAFFRHQGTNGIIQIRAAGLFEETDERSFLRYNMVMNAARVAVVFASIPWWGWLGLL